jgi:hypothetical protein
MLLAFSPNLITLAQGYGPYRANGGGGYYNQRYGNGGSCAGRNNGYYNQEGYGAANGYNPTYDYNNGGYYAGNGPVYGYSQQPQVVIVAPPQPQVILTPPVVVQRPAVIVTRPRPWGWGNGYYAHRPRFYGGSRW